MKFKITIAIVMLFQIAYTQELPSNPQTVLVFIKDSIDLKNKSLQEVKDALSKWSYTLNDGGNTNRIYKLDNSKQIERISIVLPLYSGAVQDKGGNRFVTSGILNYSKIKKNIVIVGGVKFNFFYTISAKKLIYEFTNLECSLDMQHYGKFEEEKPPSDNYNNSPLIFKVSKKDWVSVKAKYFDNLKILSEDLKEYVEHLFMSNQTVANQSPINYYSYKKITMGMTYDDVVKLLTDEGRELKNSSTQVNGNTVNQQTIIWNDLDKTKSITVTFENSKVVSKSQNNL